jgi:hypothetical protein
MTQENGTAKVVFVGSDRCSKGGAATAEEFFSRPEHRTHVKFLDLEELDTSNANQFLTRINNHRHLIYIGLPCCCVVESKVDLNRNVKLDRTQTKELTELLRTHIGGNMFVLSKLSEYIVDPSLKPFIIQGRRWHDVMIRICCDHLCSLNV